MQKINKWSIAVLLLFSVGSLLAQNRIGSPYTRYGIGDILSSNFGDSKAMGSTSLAMRSGRKLYVSNPASYSGVDSLHFIMEVGLSGGMKRMSSGSKSTLLNNVNVDYLAFGFPVTRWCAASFGLLPYSNVGYDVLTSEKTNDYTANYHYQGFGGLNKVYFGASFIPYKDLSIGFNFNYMFGGIHRQSGVEFSEKNHGMLNVTEKNSMFFSDVYFTFGAQYRLKLAGNALTIGAIWENNSNLSAKRDVLVTNALSSNSSNVIDTLFYSGDEKGKVNLPMSYGLGLAYEYSDKLILAGDFYIQDWSNSKVFGVSDSLGVSKRLGLGMEWTPDGRTTASIDYWGKVRYRAGFHYNDTYLSFNQGNTKVQDFGISFGLGLPLKRSNTSFNLFLELAQRGSLKNNLVKEQYIILGMNFSLSDIWFIKRKFD